MRGSWPDGLTPQGLPLLIPERFGEAEQPVTTRTGRLVHARPVIRLKTQYQPAIRLYTQGDWRRAAVSWRFSLARQPPRSPAYGAAPPRWFPKSRTIPDREIGGP